VMSYRPTFLGFLFLALALALTACEVLGVYEYVTEHRTSLYVAIGSCIVAAVTPGLPALADWFARSRGWRYAIGAWLGFAICLAIVLLAAIQRTGTATDAAEQLRNKAERAIAIAVSAEKQAADDYRVAQAAAIRECDIRGKKCLEAEAKAETARAALARARGDLVSAPAGEQVDPLARRLALVLPLAEPQIRLLQPLLVPFALSLLSVLFFAGWSRIDFASGATPGQPARPSPTMGKSIERGPVIEFLTDSLAGDPGNSVEATALHPAYVSWCKTKGFLPYPGIVFADALAEVCGKAGIELELSGDKVLCRDVRLAA
jgi:hypothetical protein